MENRSENRYRGGICQGKGLTPYHPAGWRSKPDPAPSPPRLELSPRKTEPQIRVGGGQSCPTFGSLGWPLAWHGAGGRASLVAVGGRKKGKPAQWKLPCGWLRRPRHTVFIESSLPLLMPHSRINPFQAAVPVWCQRRTLDWGVRQPDPSSGSAASGLEPDPGWSMTIQLFPLAENKLRILGGWVTVGDGRGSDQHPFTSAPAWVWTQGRGGSRPVPCPAGGLRPRP